MNGGADIGVVGAGIVGLCAAFALRERGASVRVYERGFAGGGQSGGEARIFRHAHDDRRLVALARESRAIWGEWGDRLGVELVSDDGAVALGPAVGRRLALLEDAGVRAEHAGVVVCAGRGTARLARGVGLALPVRVGAHARVTFAVRDRCDRLACLQDGSGHFGEVGAYAAALPGNRRYAVGLAESVGVRDDGSFLDPSSLAALADRAAAYVRRALPGLDPQPIDYVHCWVTELPWSDDAIAVWEADHILFVAGHNLFKHAPALGRAIGRAALGEPLAVALRPQSTLGLPQAEPLGHPGLS